MSLDANQIAHGLQVKLGVFWVDLQKQRIFCLLKFKLNKAT